MLTERNWLRATGRIHGAGDHGPNPAAEIAMQIAGRHAGVLAGRRPMSERAARGARRERGVAAQRRAATLPAPLVWTFDGPFERCLADIEDTLRRAIVLIGDVVARRLADRPVAAGAAGARRRRRRAAARLGALHRAALGRYGLPCLPRVRPMRTAGPLCDARRRLPELKRTSSAAIEADLRKPLPCP